MRIYKKKILSLLCCLLVGGTAFGGNYTDIYNFFSLDVPDGWQTRIFSSPSSKVKFRAPAIDGHPGASLLVFVNPAGPRKSLQADTDSRLAKLRKLGAVNIVSRTITFQDVPCSHITAELPSRSTIFESYMFSRYNRAYTIVAAVPLRSGEHNRDTVKKMMASFKSIPPDDFTEPAAARPEFGIRESVHILNEDDYPGAVGGRLNFIELTLQNTGGNSIEVGNCFRVYMNSSTNDWNQFALAAVSTNGLHVSEEAFLRYGMGASSMALKRSGRQSIMLFFRHMKRVVNDSTAEKLKINLDAWWPRKIAPGKTVTIKWPTFWFSNLDHKPLAIAGPRLKCNGKTRYTWLDMKNGRLRLIDGDGESLLKVLHDKKEEIGLRCAVIAWLMQTDPANAEYLLPYIEKGARPRILSFRAMQALAVWGRPQDLDAAYTLWKEHRMAECLDYDCYRYLSWSALDRASELITAVKLGGR